MSLNVLIPNLTAAVLLFVAFVCLATACGLQYLLTRYVNKKVDAALKCIITQNQVLRAIVKYIKATDENVNLLEEET
jgi:hypothetical protein